MRRFLFFAPPLPPLLRNPPHAPVRTAPCPSPPLLHFPGSRPASRSPIHHHPKSHAHAPLRGHFSFCIRGWPSALPRLCPLGGFPSPLPPGHTEARAEGGHGRGAGLCRGLRPECIGRSSKGRSEARDGLPCGFQRRLRLPWGRAGHGCARSGAQGPRRLALGGSVTGSSRTGPKLRREGRTLAFLLFADVTVRCLSHGPSRCFLVLKY